jgi:hemerythrin superfamily protein
MDVLKLLKQDHDRVEELFQKLEGTRGARVRGLVDEIRREVLMHSRLEIDHVYPAIRESMEELAELMFEAEEEHDVVERMLDEIAGSEPNDERFLAKCTVLMNYVRQHVLWEEKELFPALREAMELSVRRELGEICEQAKAQMMSQSRQSRQSRSGRRGREERPAMH